MELGEYIDELNASCLNPDSSNLSSHWQLLYGPSYPGLAGTVVLILLFLAGIPLNVYIIIAVTYKRLYVQPTYLLLLNLGFIDLLTCLVPMLFGIVTGLRGEISFGSTDYVRCQVCKIVAVFVLLTILQSFNIALLSLERLVFFVSPLRYQTSLTARRTALALAGIWLLGAALTIPPLLGYGDLAFAMWCGYVFLHSDHTRKSFVYFCVCAILGASLVLFLVFSNLWIAGIALKSMKRVRGLRVRPNRVIPVQSSSFVRGNDKNARKAAFRRKMSRDIARRQLRFFQVFGSIMMVNFATLIPAIALVVMATITRAVPGEFIAFVQVTLMSQVILHPVLETSITPELRRIVISHCQVCPAKLLDTKVGGVLCRSWQRLSKCCSAELWSKALEKKLVDMEAFEMDGSSNSGLTLHSTQ